MKQLKFDILIIAGVLALLVSSCSSSKQTTVSKPMSETPEKGNFQKGQTWSPGDMEFSEKFIEAVRQEEKGDNQSAINLLTECLTIKPTDAATSYELAKIYLSLKKYDVALNYSSILPKKDPNNQWYLQQYTDILAASNKFKEAATAYADYIKHNPDNIDRYFDYAYYLTKAQEYDEAIKAYNQIETQTGINEDVSQEKERLYLKMGKVDKAIDEANKLIANNPGEPSYYAMLADLYSANKMDDKAMDALQKLLQIDPNNPQAELALSEYYYKKGDNDQAFDNLKKAFESPELELDKKIQILYPYLNSMIVDPKQRSRALILGRILVTTNPSSARSYATFGDILSQAYAFDSALIEYKKSISYDSSKFSVWQQILLIDSRNGRTDSLLNDSKHALSLFPDQILVYYFNGIANMQKKQYQTAINVFGKGLKIGSDNKQILGDMYADEGDAFNIMKQYHASDSAYEMALIFEPDNSTVLNNYAYYLSLRSENLDKAEKMSKHSNELSPNNAAFEDTYAWVLYKEKKYADAKVWSEKSMSHGGSSDAENLDHYGNILYQLGDVDGAVKYWKMAKDLHLDSAVIDKKITDRKLYE